MNDNTELIERLKSLRRSIERCDYDTTGCSESGVAPDVTTLTDAINALNHPPVYSPPSTPAPVAAGELERGVRLALQSFKDLEERGGGTMPGTVKTLQDILARATPGADGGARATNAEIEFWSRRHGVDLPNATDARCAFEDAQHFKPGCYAAMNPTASADHTKG